MKTTWQELTAGLTDDELEDLLDMLSPSQRRTLQRHYGLTGLPPQSFDEIAPFFGVRTARIAALHAKAMQNLRTAIERYRAR